MLKLFRDVFSQHKVLMETNMADKYVGSIMALFSVNKGNALIILFALSIILGIYIGSRIWP